MAERQDLADDLLDMPWRVSAALGAAAWATVGILLATTPTESVFGRFVHALAPMHWLIPIFFGLASTGSYLLSRKKRRLLAANRSIEAIRGLTWQQFEILIGQHFGEMGYAVSELGGGGPDGGVDLIARREGELYVVQCKHWKAFSVGIRELKELFATVKDREATGGILVATSPFSEEARAFASRHSEIRLMDGRQLADAIGKAAHSEPESVTDCCCPKCGSRMVRRTARSGATAGKQFMGCSRFPACKGTRSLATDAR